MIGVLLFDEQWSKVSSSENSGTKTVNYDAPNRMAKLLPFSEILQISWWL